MTSSNSPTLRLRRLATMLRQSREAAGYTAAQVGNKFKWSSGKVSKMETTETKRIKADDLDKLMNLYKITDPDKRAAMHALAKDARQRGWWSKYKEVFTERALPDFEAEASVIRTFETQMIPGLLQTQDYAEALLRGGRFANPEIIKKKAEARMVRREILVRRTPTRLRAVIDEGALHKKIGGEKVLKEQLSYLHHMAQLPNIDLQVLPTDTGSHAGLCAPYTILEFPDPLDLPIVYIDTASNGLFLEEPDEVEAHSATFGDVQGSALSTTQSADLVLDILKSLEEVASQ